MTRRRRLSFWSRCTRGQRVGNEARARGERIYHIPCMSSSSIGSTNLVCSPVRGTGCATVQAPFQISHATAPSVKKGTMERKQTWRGNVLGRSARATVRNVHTGGSTRACERATRRLSRGNSFDRSRRCTRRSQNRSIRCWENTGARWVRKRRYGRAASESFADRKAKPVPCQGVPATFVDPRAILANCRFKAERVPPRRKRNQSVG